MSSSSDRQAGVRPRAGAAARALVFVLLLLSAALVWHDLGAREVLGRDEPATIVKLDQRTLGDTLRVTRMKITGQPGNMQPLYFLLQRLFWPAVGRNPFMLRFLPAAFAVLGVAVTYKLGQALLGPAVGSVGALLTALLPLQVQYAQIARPYALLAFFSLASAFFLVRALATGRSKYWVGFFLSATLDFYTHYNALFVLAAEGVFAGMVWLSWLAGLRREGSPTRRLLRPVLAFLAVGLACLPGLIRLAGLLRAEAGSPPEATAAGIRLNLAFCAAFLNDIGLSSAWLQGLILAAMALGLLVILLRRHWQIALLMVAWLAIPFVTLSLVAGPRPFEPRYVIFVPPVALLMGGQGVAAAGDRLARLNGRGSPGKTRWAAAAALSLALALLMVPALRTYYQVNRGVARLGQELQFIERHTQPGDAVVISPRVFTRPLNAPGADVLYLTEHPLPADLEQWGQYQRLWLLYTSFLPAPEMQEPLDQWVQSQGPAFARVQVKSISALAYRNLSITDLEASLQDRIAVLEAAAEDNPGGQETKWQRYGVLADAYQSLGDLYASRSETSLAAEYERKAAEARAAAPPPW